MAVCVRSVIHDGDLGTDPATGLGVPVDACMVHGHHWPCPRQGQPAVGTPLHAFNPAASREQAVIMWALRTARQRPLIIHTPAIADPADHVVEKTCLPCPCGAEILPPVPAAYARGTR